MKMRIFRQGHRVSSFSLVSCFFSLIIILFIAYPLIYMSLSTPLSSLASALGDGEVTRAISLSLVASFIASLVSFIFGTPLAYVLARKSFKGKRVVESIVDIPIVVPHPVVGIALLSILGRNVFPGNFLHGLGVKVTGSLIGIIIVLTFVGSPFYINTVKNAFQMVPERLEKVSRSLGASELQTFIRVTLPLSFKSILSGLLMCAARGISEFGAVIVIAYHPMVAPVLIFERFESYGLSYSKPVAVLLIFVCLIIFVLLRVLSLQEKVDYGRS